MPNERPKETSPTKAICIHITAYFVAFLLTNFVKFSLQSSWGGPLWKELTPYKLLRNVGEEEHRRYFAHASTFELFFKCLPEQEVLIL